MGGRGGCSSEKNCSRPGKKLPLYGKPTSCPRQRQGHFSLIFYDFNGFFVPGTDVAVVKIYSYVVLEALEPQKDWSRWLTTGNLLGHFLVGLKGRARAATFNGSSAVSYSSRKRLQLHRPILWADINKRVTSFAFGTAERKRPEKIHKNL